MKPSSIYNSILSLVAVCILLLISTIAQSQSNSREQTFYLQPGDEFSTIIYSAESPKFLYDGFDTKIFQGGSGIDNPNLGKNQHRLTFTVSDVFTGKTHLDIEYFEEIGVRTHARYTRLIFDVAESQLLPKHDYKTIEVNSANQLISVLENDFTTHSPLELVQIAHQESGQASISNGQVSFSPDADFMGMAYVNYVVRNALGREAMGTATICVLDPKLVAEADVINLVTMFDQSVPVLLPSDGFDMNAGLELVHGVIEVLGPDVFEYTPSTDESVLESFIVRDSDNGLTRSINIQIVGRDKENNSVVDDKVFTEVNHPVNFDVLDNDFVKGNALVSFSDELTHLGGGDFSYSPPQNFRGIKQFFYEVFDGYEYNIGEIVIHVDNYYPEQLDQYEFVTKKATPFIINYKAPIDAFGFQIIGQPSSGKLRLLSGNSSYYYACGYDIGYNLLIYEPNGAFTGIEEFTVKYCINDEQCEDIDIAINVIESDANCHCSGSGCIWAGDANADGKAFISDLLAIGYHIGATGASRDLGDVWTAEFGDDWGQQQIGSGADVKHLDANGDGIITAADTVALSQHYNSYNNLVPQENLVTKDYPVALVPNVTSVDSGDWLSLDIVIGTDEYPVLDVHGLAYTLNLNPGIVDSASLIVTDHSSEWLGNNSPILHMAKQPSDGRVEIGSTRTTGRTVSGKGLTHTVGFIVEEDIEGLRRSRNNEIDILIENISFIDGAGNTFNVPDASVTIEVNLDGEFEDLQIEESLHIIPNPATDYIRLYLNGDDVFHTVEIYDIAGRQLFHADNLDTHDFSLSTDGMSDGMYLAKVVTATQSYTKKVKVAKTR